jgi:hypothetical protein
MSFDEWFKREFEDKKRQSTLKEDYKKSWNAATEEATKPRPIDNKTPKKGTRINLFNGFMKIWQIGFFKEELDEFVDQERGLIIEATHWLPLPPDPIDE